MQHPTANASPPPRRGGRPSQSQAGEIRARILTVATDLFLTQGYGDTSIETIAKQAGISKRTFYHRFEDKADLFGAVVHHLIARLRPPHVSALFTGGTLEEILQRIAKIILRASLSPQALALHRLMVSEATRFPELAIIVDTEGSRREAIHHVSRLLDHHTVTGYLTLDDTIFAAEQFLQMVVSVPQRRALGLGTAMEPAQLDAWAQQAVLFFLHGCRASR